MIGFYAPLIQKRSFYRVGLHQCMMINAPRAHPLIFELGVPVLGICYGQQVMMHQLGGQVEQSKGSAEFGRAYLDCNTDVPAFLSGWFNDGAEEVWMSHADHVSAIAPGFQVYASSPKAPFALIADLQRNFIAVQFHPEVHHTPKGAVFLQNFITLAGFERDWTMGAYKEQAIAAIRKQVGDKQVICGLSGGVTVRLPPCWCIRRLAIS